MVWSEPCYPLQYFIKKKLKMKLIFSIQRNIKVSYQFVSTLSLSKFPRSLRLSLLKGMINHSQITQSNKFAISSQYLKKEVRNRGHLWHADKLQRFYKLVLSFFMDAARHVQSTQNRIFYRDIVMLIVTCYLLNHSSQSKLNSVQFDYLILIQS